MKIVSVIWEDCHDGQLERDMRMILLNAKGHFASFRKFNPDAKLILVNINCNYSFPGVTTMRITMSRRTIIQYFNGCTEIRSGESVTTFVICARLIVLI